MVRVRVTVMARVKDRIRVRITGSNRKATTIENNTFVTLTLLTPNP
jgi:hypothetical protein